LALEAALVAITCLTAWNAQRIRQRLASVGSSADEQPLPSTEQPVIGRWGDVQWSDDDSSHDPLADLEHYRLVHFFYASVGPTAFVGLLAFYELWSRTAGDISAITLGGATALGLLCLTISCVWLVLARSFGTVPEDQLPESRNLESSFREIQWASVVVGAAILGCVVWAPLDLWAGRVLLVWILAICGEQIVRLLFFWLWPSSDDGEFLRPLHLQLREAVFTRRNPIASLFETIETRLGVSFRSSWAIRFVKLAILPLAMMVVLLLWGLGSLSVVKIDHLGVRESFGQISDAPLHPGLHWKLPWPFGRVRQYPAKKVFVTSIGFISNPQRQPAFLWSKKHAQEEFSLVLGDGAELMSVDTMVYYKIHEDKERFLDYVYRFQNPDDALKAYAYHVLMEYTRSATLDEILSTNRARFADNLEQRLRQYATDNRLGIDVVDVALIGLHPPIAAAADYLDVISAGVDADRFQIEATGKKRMRIEDAKRESASAIATASAEAEIRLGQAQEESSEFIAMGQAYSVAPDSLQQRLWFEALEEILEGKQFALVEKSLADGPGGILLDQRGSANVRDPVPVSREAIR
jgi:regulator of protease activity HflC (stomatin/prohibitin superfamily)